MSSTSIQDQGYTPADFLEKLFRRPATSSSSQNIPKPLSTISNYWNPNTYSTSSPQIPGDGKYSPTKLLRTHSMNQDERISTKKFKIFYNAFMDGVFSQLQSAQIWQKFQKSLTNPFQFDNFIDHIRNLKQQQQKQKSISTTCTSLDLTPDPSLYQRRSISTYSKPSITRLPVKNCSVGKAVDGKNQRQLLKNTMKYVRSIVRHGEKFIKSK